MKTNGEIIYRSLMTCSAALLELRRVNFLVVKWYCDESETLYNDQLAERLENINRIQDELDVFGDLYFCPVI